MEKIADSVQIDELILKIKNIQANANPKYWKMGLFPSYRFNKYWLYLRKDNSIFYTALIVKILQEIGPFLSEKNYAITNEIISNAIGNYTDYENITGIKTYNFYPTKPSKHFGNGFIFKHFKHFQLPDDADDTALIYYTSNPNNIDLNWLKNKLKIHANNGKTQLAGVSGKLNNLKAYSTWFGKKMPIEFDVVVHANILALFIKNNLEFDDNAMASWHFIKDSILSGNYESKPFEVSHNYANSIVIAYFVTPILSKISLPECQLVAITLNEFLLRKLNENALNSIEKAMVSSSLNKLGNCSFIIDNQIVDKRTIENYSLFLAGMLSAYSNKFLQYFAPNPFFHIRWRCEAHNLALLLEAKVLEKQIA